MNIIVINMVVGSATDENNNGTVQQLSKPHKLMKNPVPNELFYDFIKKIAHKMPNSNYFLIDLFAYKKATYFDEEPLEQHDESNESSLLHKFCQDLLPYYCKDKQFFLTRKMSYNNLNTILRQICRHNSIECKSERKYDKSKTHIVYYICDMSSNE